MQRKLIPKEMKDEIAGKVKSGAKVLDLAKQYGVWDKSIYDNDRIHTALKNAACCLYINIFQDTCLHK